MSECQSIMFCFVLFYKPSAIGTIPGLPADLEARQGKTFNKRMSFGDHLEREVEKKPSSKGSDKQRVARRSSVDHAERSRDCTFTGVDSPFHLWYPVELRIDGRDYESAGHYLVEKSLGKCHT